MRGLAVKNLSNLVSVTVEATHDFPEKRNRIVCLSKMDSAEKGGREEQGMRLSSLMRKAPEGD